MVQLRKMKNQSDNHLKLASARSEQIKIIEKALEKAIQESRLYKQVNNKNSFCTNL